MNSRTLARAVLKATAIFLVGFCLVAAVHELLPGFCVPVNADGSIACPFCNLIYTLLIVASFFIVLDITLAVRTFTIPPIPVLVRNAYRARWLVRGPPASFSSFLCA